MVLKEYKKKRDFEKTSEPEGGKDKGKDDVFVIQKHDARNLHYDVRLSMNGVLKSWAVPKRITGLDGEKRLAVETEDHPLSYGSFEGIIPEGNYGAGKVEIWDKGKYKNIRGVSMQKSYEQGQIEVNLKGKKLKGNFTLVNTKFNGNKKNWLLIKTKDDKYGKAFENG